jgi:hypothetical protein
VRGDGGETLGLLLAGFGVLREVGQQNDVERLQCDWLVGLVLLTHTQHTTRGTVA